MPPFDSDSYTAVFGGQNRNPAQIDYVFYSTAVDMRTQWPFLAEDGAFIAPSKLDVSATQPNLLVYMPDAAIASVGQDCLVRNQGTHAFTVVDFEGNTIINILPGASWLVWITDDDSVAGVWASVQFGASTSAANAAALAGAGLRANITKLDQNLLTTPLLGNHIIGLGDRALVLQNNGGAVTYAVDPLVPPVNGWFTYIINAGTGTLTVTPPGGVTIDGAANKVFAPAENAILFADGSNLHTLGYGRSLVNTVTGTSINMTGGTLALTPPQIQAQVQNYVGTLTSNQILDYGGGVGYWFVHNNTTGPFTVTARINGLDTGVVIPQGTFSILRSDGSKMDIAFTAGIGTVTSVATTTGELVGGTITTTGTLGLADTAIAPGAYGAVPSGAGTGGSYPVVNFDQKGRATLAVGVALGSAAFKNADGSPGGIPLLDSSGLVPSINGGVPTGAIFDYSLASAPAGYVFCVGTITKTGSGGTARANDDCHNLFVGLWASYPNTTAPVTPGGRGANAEADWLAGKAIALADMRGRTRVGKDSMGAFAAAGRVTGATASPNGTTMGATGGSETGSASTGVSLSVSGGISGSTYGAQSVDVGGSTTLDENMVGCATGGAQVTSHPHAHNWGGHFGTNGEALGVTGSFSGSGAGTFPSAAFVNMSPFSLVNVIIKL